MRRLWNSAIAVPLFPLTAAYALAQLARAVRQEPQQHTKTLHGPMSQQVLADLATRNRQRLGEAQARLGTRWLIAEPMPKPRRVNYTYEA